MKNIEKNIGIFNSINIDLMDEYCGVRTLALDFMASSQLEIHKIFNDLKKCPQNPKHHPEGNAWNHTIKTLIEAGKYRKELPRDWQHAFMWGMLLHDIGKPATTDPETLTAYGHDKVGAKLAKEFLEEITEDKDLIDKVYGIVRGHMRARMLVKQRSGMKAWKKLQEICRLDVLAYVSMCDSDGRGFPPEGKDEVFYKITEMHNKLKDCNNG